MVGVVGSESAALRNSSASPLEHVSPIMGLGLAPPSPSPSPSAAGALLCVWPLRLRPALDDGVDECERESEGEGECDRVARDDNKVVTRRHVHDDDVAEECCDTESVENTTPACVTPLLFSESAVLRGYARVRGCREGERRRLRINE